MKMNTKLTLLAFAFVPAIVAFTVGGTSAKLQPGSRLWVAGTSTVKDFTCQAKIVDAIVQIPDRRHRAKGRVGAAERLAVECDETGARKQMDRRVR